MGKFAVLSDKEAKKREARKRRRKPGGVLGKLLFLMKLGVYGVAVYVPVVLVWMWYTGYTFEELMVAGGVWMTPVTSFMMTPIEVMRDDSVVGDLGMLWGAIAVGLLILMGLHVLTRLLGGLRGAKWHSVMLILVMGYSGVCSCYWLEVLARV
ncbi:hypothetical protein JD969_14390 [Planctomycetota bacterium]|nr:hypothetical protein JD969_14390 [Planctomycetota bacterium]